MSQLLTLEPKDPNDVVDYRIDWSRWLPTGDTILVSEWFVPDTIEMDTETNDDDSTTIWLSGGTPGPHALTNRITTSQGRTKDRTITIRVKEL